MNVRVSSTSNERDYIDLWREASNHIKQNRRARAIRIFRDLANKGHTLAFVEMGNIYELGGGDVTQDFEQAERYYQLAVQEINEPAAHLALGRLYYRTAKSNEDYRKSFHHFMSVIELTDHMGAQFGLALLHHFGLGVERDINEAKRYYELASNQGHALALRNLAKLRYTNSKCAGTWIYMRACYRILKIGLRKPYDSRMGIRWR